MISMRRPNILLLYTDQQRWDALGANGNDEIQTPNLDRLAAQGANFSHYFVQNPVCMPSRVSFLSGQYPSTLGITHMGVPVPQELPTLPRLLKPYGYDCANIGKLHFLPHANRDHRTPHPDYGFDHLEISDEPGVYEDAYRAWAKSKDPAQLEHLSVGLPPATAQWYGMMGVKDTVTHPQAGGRADFKRAVPFGGDDGFTHSAFVAEQTMEYLRRQRQGSPFLCIAGFYSPHAPWVVPQTFLDRYDPDSFTLPEFPPEVEAQRLEGDITEAQLRSARHGYYAMVTEVDHHVGRILDCLEEQGLADETLVIFTSDHGEWLGEHLRYGKGMPGPDCVSRVPFIMRGPTVSPGTCCDQIVEAVDVVPTLLECCGIQVAPHLQGDSLATALDGGAVGGDGAALMEHSGAKTLRSEGFRYLVRADGSESLWDLDQDPGEYLDVAGAAKYVEVLAEHRHMLLRRLVAMERPKERVWSY
jgi:arylsulfatase A-like enzyme